MSIFKNDEKVITLNMPELWKTPRGKCFLESTQSMLYQYGTGQQIFNKIKENKTMAKYKCPECDKITTSNNDTPPVCPNCLKIMIRIL